MVLSSATFFFKKQAKYMKAEQFAFQKTFQAA